MTTCPDCGHPVVEHSREPGVGCLHDVRWLVSQGYMKQRRRAAKS